MTRGSTLRAGAAAIGWVLGAVAALVAADAPRAQPPEASGVAAEAGAPAVLTVGGFRSARWGMDEAEIKAAIQKDFGVSAGTVSTTVNAVERTTVLTIMVRELLEGAGAAQISYVLGYKSKRLIQVTILWGTPVDSRVPAENIVTAANQLRQLFLDSGYEPKTIIANARLRDGSILVFEGQDAARRTTLLRLSSTPSPETGPQKKGGIASIALSLSYILDSQHPDIFSLKKGQF